MGNGALYMEGFENYKELIKIRVLMDENLPKAKQLLTNLIKKLEKIR